MSNNKDIIKVDLLRRKINEHFSRNPKSNSLIVNSSIGDRKTYWHVSRTNDKSYKISEVNTHSRKFIIEQDTPVKNIAQDSGEDKDIGLDQEPTRDAVQAATSGPEKSQEEKTLSGALEGKPIQDVSVEYGKDTTHLLIKTPESDIPVKLSFYKSGKVVLTYKDRPHILKKA